MIQGICVNCGMTLDYRRMDYRCPSCGGIYDIPNMVWNTKIYSERSGLLKYAPFFGLVIEDDLITLGEGGTPLIRDDYHGTKLFHKMESNNPTGSYKDRGTVVLINYLRKFQHKLVVEDSSGNAGASLAAYAARSGIKARIYVPESASGPKRAQIEAYGAQVVKIPGARQNAAEAVRKEADAGVLYASHAYMPMGLLGIATIAYELYAALGQSIGTIIAPVGHGGLLLGVMRGFMALKNVGLVSIMPFFVGVQAENCSPVADMYTNNLGANTIAAYTVAEGVRVTKPVRGKAIVDCLQKNNGIIVKVPENDILPAYVDLARRGIHLEPTSALCWAAMKKQITKLEEPIVLIQTGAGLKYQYK